MWKQKQRSVTFLVCRSNFNFCLQGTEKNCFLHENFSCGNLKSGFHCNNLCFFQINTYTSLLNSDKSSDSEPELFENKEEEDTQPQTIQDSDSEDEMLHSKKNGNSKPIPMDSGQCTFMDTIHTYIFPLTRCLSVSLPRTTSAASVHNRTCLVLYSREYAIPNRPRKYIH